MDVNTKLIHFVGLMINLSTLWICNFSSSWDEVVHFMDFDKVVYFTCIHTKLVHFVN